MAISAQRFTVLDRETNISTAKFKADMDSMILNDPANALKDANTQLQSLLDSANQKALEGKETLEDAVDKYTPLRIEQKAFIAGAEYQAKRMYSEKEVLEIIRQYALEEHLITSSKPDIWFEQFKKK